MKFLRLAIWLFMCCLFACNKSSPNKPRNEYIHHDEEYSENIMVSTPEAFELFNVAISLTDYGLLDNNYVNQQSEYYQAAQAYFGSLKNHEFITLIETFCKQDLGSGSDSIENYNNVKKASLYIQLNEDTLTIDSDLYDFVPESMKNFIEQLLQSANLFLKESNFIQFYQTHSDVYQDIANKFKAAIPAQTVWNWLEDKFVSIQYQTYQIPLSPLTGGSHCTELDKLTGDTIYMIVPSPDEYIDNRIDEGNLTLFLFTEIDHNYVNPISDRHLDAINTAFVDLTEWNQEQAYQASYDTFNEYMTWAVFTLFAYDQYSESEFEAINAQTVDNMINNRKFIRFKAFNDELLRLYKNKEAYHSIEELFVPILNWAGNQ